MTRVSIAGICVLGTLSVALVLGTQIVDGDASGVAVTTVLGMLGLGISQLIGNRDAAVTAKTTQELSKDLHNGTFEKLLREALLRIANEDEFKALEIRKENDNNG